MAPYLCAPACVSGPWPSKRSATLHRNSCMLWQEHIGTQASKRRHSPSSNGSASGSDNDVATIRAIARRKKKARLAKKPNVTFRASEASTSSAAGSSQSNDLNTTVQTLNHQSASDTASQPSEEVVPTEQLASAANTRLETTRTSVGEPVQASLSSSRPQRNRRLPARYQDVLPEGTAVIVNAEPLVEEQVPLRRRVILHVREQLKTQLNSFGLWREYLQKPSHDPDGEVGIQDMANIPSAQDPDDDGHTSDDSHCDATLNPTQTLLTGWQNNGNSTKSNGEMDQLANLIRRPEFQVSELQGYSAHTANAKITQADENWDYNKLKDSFLETSVDIEVLSGDKNIPSKVFSIPGLLRTAEQAKKSLGQQASVPPLIAPGARRKKTLNLFTYKWHALMDYIWFIRWFGPTDIYSTQLVRELRSEKNGTTE
ncbi:hypothetical protein HHX47_DHR2000678 [Lentinula edodes]|nr:hypothetical protein HHX47_DHR2000678 [Lentinula edodes]